MIDWPAERQRFVEEFVEPRGDDPVFPFPVRALAMIERELSDRLWPRVLDCGSGFSSVAFRLIEHADVVTCDHDGEYMAAIQDYCDGRGLGYGVFATLYEVLEQRDEFDLILVDHGPDAQARIRDLPTLATMLAPDGVIWLDDMHKKHGGQMEHILKQLGFTVERIPTELRRVGRAKLKGEG